MKTSNYLRNLPIRRKLTLLLLTPCVVVLLLAGAALFGFQIRMFRNDFERDLHAVADIVGANCTATITFMDAQAATEILSSLRAKQHIVSAILILPDGQVFASYGRHRGDPAIASEDRFVFREKDVLMIKPVMLEKKQVATLNLVSDYRSVYSSLMELVSWMLLIIVVAGAGVAVLLSNWLQRLMSDPILRLAQTAQRVAEEKDYSVRAHEESGAELGILTRTFNQMLARIQQQDEAITLSHKRLLENSRLSGMAEVATGVLHNVGNVLNSVSVSTTLVSDRLRESNLPKLRRVTSMLDERNGGLVEFLTSDPKGKLLPQYLGTLAEQLETEQTELVSEVNSLSQHIEHIKEIVAMQQSYAKVSGAHENLSATELVEDALRINAAAFDRHRIQVVREFEENTPQVCVDRHKVLQILINLVRNAKYALDARNSKEKLLVIRVGPASCHRVKIAICDNGVGIAPENLIKIFNHGFTTKKDGHGFGLHSGANAAKEMGGDLSARSDGLGQGATFTLELPVATTTSQEAATAKQVTL